MSGRRRTERPDLWRALLVHAVLEPLPEVLGVGVRVELADLRVSEAAAGPVEDGQVVQLAHLPAGHVLHQARLLVTVPAQLLQVSASQGTGSVILEPSVPELAKLGGKQHCMDIIFPLFPSNFTKDFPLSKSHPL